MTDRDHLTWGELLDMLDDADSKGRPRSHLEDCEPCRGRLEKLRGWMEALPEALDPGAPDVWRHRAEQRAVPRGFLRPMSGTYVAHVVFDSAEDVRSGIRSTGSGPRQWLLATERLEIEVALSHESEPAPFGVSGQIFSVAGEPPPLGGCLVRLEVSGRTRDETRSEPHGEFNLRERPSSPFHLVVVGDGWEVSTPELTP
ncbi:MAG TPA: hypothetical protein VFQ05_15880 [Candidatus Eisenbacteria bacterium]|nr:hypothetical protein [Candidatus Eisenbacteria bacterium]